jgi:hypothetical protein
VPKPPPAVTGAVSWRSEGITYRKNEVFLDVVESVNLLVAANGTPIRSEILGQLKMRSYLSGMPELKTEGCCFNFYLRGGEGLFESCTWAICECVRWAGVLNAENVGNKSEYSCRNMRR